MFNEKDLNFGQSDLAGELVRATMDDDVQSDCDIVNGAKKKLNIDLNEAIREFLSCGRRKSVKNWPQ